MRSPPPSSPALAPALQCPPSPPELGLSSVPLGSARARLEENSCKSGARQFTVISGPHNSASHPLSLKCQSHLHALYGHCTTHCAAGNAPALRCKYLLHCLAEWEEMRMIVGCPVQSQFGFRPPLSAAGLLLTIRTATRRPTGAIWWPNLELMQVAPSGGQFCN